ncbi:MAG: SusD/RagB family nutrient-binding outer membrane lipoprotein [Prevotellaceae bacterium]|nr:SusD/RagB family nutrient-binding outer membrane lipoprotein [Prevotellaceae bacterium]
MKKIFLYITIAAFSLVGLNGCNDFGDMNVDPEHLSGGNLNYNLLFTGAQVQALGSDWDVWRNGVIYCSTMIQHTTSVGWTWNYCFYDYSEGYNAAFWEVYSSDNRGAIREIITIVNQWKDKEGFGNDYQIARIMKAYIFHRMTDLYGDIPYFEVGRLDEGIGYPKYDTQKAIYDDLLKELDEAQAAISGSSSQLGSADLYYGGDASKWKKLANSLMLRVAMRLSKVDQTTAKTYAAKALANGVFTSVDDNAMLVHTDGNATNDSAEPYGKIFGREDPATFFISETFMNILRGDLTNSADDDPRIALIGSICTDTTENPAEPYTSGAYVKGSADPALQKGLPVGYVRYRLSTAGADEDRNLADAPNPPSADKGYIYQYSMPSRYTYSDPVKGVTMLVTHAETQLLLAEAAVRGWVSGQANAYYEAGVQAAMEQFKFYSGASELYTQHLTAAAVSNYLTAHPLSGTDEEKYEQINTQYYITTFCDEYEAFANWRRSGYPALTPVKNSDYKGSRGALTFHSIDAIPRRFTYPSSEAQSNPKGYAEGLKGLTPATDRMSSRVWWDKE